ncbi:MAG TPA: hypothetical protein VJ548_08305 [Azospira sp.]|nr:hypothetical protein [Azospira sp.]
MEGYLTAWLRVKVEHRRRPRPFFFYTNAKKKKPPTAFMVPNKEKNSGQAEKSGAWNGDT